MNWVEYNVVYFFFILEPRVCPVNWVEYNIVCFFYFRTTSVSGELGGVQLCLLLLPQRWWIVELGEGEFYELRLSIVFYYMTRTLSHYLITINSAINNKD